MGLNIKSKEQLLDEMSSGSFVNPIQTGKGRARYELQSFMENQAESQSAKAEELFAELDAQGRPVMEAQVQRQTEIAELAQRFAREGMPEAQREAAMADIQNNQMTQLSAAGSLGGGLRGLGGAQASTAQQYRQLNAQDSAIAQQNQGQYLNSLSALGQAEANAEQYNTLLPFEQKSAEARAYEAAALGTQYQSLYFPYQDASQRQQTAADITGTTIGAAGQIGGALITASA